MAQKTYYITGLHCDSCKILIESEIKERLDIVDIFVSMKNKSITIKALSDDKLPSLDEINKLFNDQGYTFSENPQKDKIYALDYALAIIAFLILFFLINRIGENPFESIMGVTSYSSYVTFLLFGVIAGFSGCAALNGGILLGLINTTGVAFQNSKRAINKTILGFFVGRIVVYAILGGILTIIGAGLSINTELTAILTIVVSVFMLFIALSMLGIRFFEGMSSKFGRKILSLSKDTSTNWRLPLVLGGLTFFVPCAFSLAAITATLTSINFLDGFLKLFLFSVGTLPALAILGFGSIKLYGNKRFSNIFNIAIGLGLFYLSITNINGQLNVLNLYSFDDFRGYTAGKLAYSDNSYQVAEITAEGFDYYPKVIKLKADVPTKLRVTAISVDGCATAMYAKDLYPEPIYLKEGLNEVEFTPSAGRYKISCTMGMVPPVTVIVE